MIIASKDGKIEFDPKRQYKYAKSMQGAMTLMDIQPYIDTRDNFTDQEKRKIRGFFYKV